MKDIKEDLTVEFYNKNAASWVGSHNDENFWLSAMQKLKEVKPQGSILEIGTGGGRDAKELIALGYDYIGTDISSGLLEVARKNNPGIEFYEQSVYDLDFSKRFDAFWASAVLLHIPKSRIDEALKSISNVLKSESVGFISLKKGDGEQLLEEDGGSRFFSYYQEDEFREILKRNGFEVVWFEEQIAGSRTNWLKFIVRRV